MHIFIPFQMTIDVNVSVPVFRTLVILMIVHGITSFKFVFFPNNMKSHLMYFANLGKLLQSRGHSVTFVIGSSFKRPAVLDTFSVETYHMAVEPIYQTENFTNRVVKAALDQTIFSYWETMEIMHDDIKSSEESCTSFLDDYDLIDKIKREEFDFAVIDIFPCQASYVYKLSLRFAILGIMPYSWVFRLPDIPSYVPMFLAPFAHPMTSFQRSINLLLQILFANFAPLEDGHHITKYIHEKPYRPYVEVLKTYDLYLTLYDILTESVRPSLQNMVSVSGVNVAPSKPIDDISIASFIDSSAHGVILVSFGSWLSSFPNNTLSKLLNGLSHLEENVIFKFTDDVQRHISKNILTKAWLPQNDILGHPKTKLFITHAGLNSVTESVFHGVPMIALPLFGDQFHNAATIEAKRFGIWMSIASFTPQELTENILKVTTQKEYQISISKASGIFKDKIPRSKEEVVFWLEHVVKHGGAHLKNPAVDLSWYQYLMLDVLVFFLFILIVLCITIYLLFHLVIKMCRCALIGKIKVD